MVDVLLYLNHGLPQALPQILQLLSAASDISWSRSLRLPTLTRGFPKLMGTLLGAPIIRGHNTWGLYIGGLYFGKVPHIIGNNLGATFSRTLSSC